LPWGLYEKRKRGLKDPFARESSDLISKRKREVDVESRWKDGGHEKWTRTYGSGVSSKRHEREILMGGGRRQVLMLRWCTGGEKGIKGPDPTRGESGEG